MNPEPSSDWDHDLAAAITADPLPTAPANLMGRVRHRLRRRRLAQRAAVTFALAVVALGVLVWQLRPQPSAQVARVKTPAPTADELSEPVFLRSVPPVDTLNVLARQQAAYLTVLDQMEKEF